MTKEERKKHLLNEIYVAGKNADNGFYLAEGTLKTRKWEERRKRKISYQEDERYKNGRRI